MSEAVEKAALVGLHENGIFSSTCEMLDTEDPEVKVFRFKEGCKWGRLSGPNYPKPRAVRSVTLYHHWSTFDVGEREGRYRITTALDTVPGYIAVLEGTTRPEVIKEAAPDKLDMERCELAIMNVLESEPRIPLRALKRKVSAHRMRCFDACLNQLADKGELSIETIKGNGAARTWVRLSARDSEGVVTVSNENADSDITEE